MLQHVPPFGGLAAGCALLASVSCGASTDPIRHEPGLSEPGLSDEVVMPAPALPGPWLGSFEAGLDADEQLWLLPLNGAPVAAMQSNGDPSRSYPRGTDGYSDQHGHISTTVLDAAHSRIFVANREQSGNVVRWLDLNTGTWTRLELAGVQTLRATDRGALIVSSDSGTLTATAAVGTELETVARVPAPSDAISSDSTALRYAFGGTERVLISPVGQFERAESGWRAVPSPLPGQRELAWVAASSDSTRLCIVATDGSGWLVDSNGARDAELPFAGDHCSFSPDGELAAFTGRPGQNQLQIVDRAGAPVASFDYLFLDVSREDYAYGTTGQDLVRLDWRTLQLETLPSPSLCPTRDPQVLGPALFHRPHLTGSFAVVEAYCGCTDCHLSAVYLLPLAPGSVPRPLLPATEWDILQIGALADGSVLIAQRGHDAVDHIAVATGGDHFLRISSEGNLTELGPFPGVPSPLHAPSAF